MNDGLITPLENPPQYSLQEVLQNIPEIQFHSGYIEHPFITHKENKRICLIVPDDLYSIYKTPIQMSNSLSIPNWESKDYNITCQKLK